jgi:hypothetical protein
VCSVCRVLARLTLAWPKIITDKVTSARRFCGGLRGDASQVYVPFHTINMLLASLLFCTLPLLYHITRYTRFWPACSFVPYLFLYLTSLVPYHTIHTLLASLLFRAICRVGQKRMYKQYLTAYLVFSLPTMPCIHRMYINIFLTDPSYMLYGQDGPTANHQNLIKLKKNIFSARGGRTRAFGCEMRFWQYVSLARSCAF